MSIPRAIRHWIFDTFHLDPRSLAVARILFAFFLIAANFPRYTWIGHYPSSLFVPPLGLGILFDSFPAPWVMRTLDIVAVALSCSLLLGWRTRVMGLLLVGVLLVGNTFLYSFGKINHDLLIPVTLATMSFSGWGGKYSLDARDGPVGGDAPAWPAALLALVISLGMLSAALPKVAAGWLDPDSQKVAGFMVLSANAIDRETLLGSFLLNHGTSILWEFLDWSTIALEGGFVFCMFSLRAFRIACATAVFFHAGVHFSMDISFSANLLAYGVFAEWRSATDRLSRFPACSAVVRLVSSLPRWVFAILTVATALYFGSLGSVFALIFAGNADGVWGLDSLLVLLACGAALSPALLFVRRRFGNVGDRRPSAVCPKEESP